MLYKVTADRLIQYAGNWLAPGQMFDTAEAVPASVAHLPRNDRLSETIQEYLAHGVIEPAD